MSVLANLVVKMSADTSALERGLKGAKGHMSKLGGVMKAGALAGGAALVGLGVASLKMGMDFEKSMAEVKTLLPDISEKAFGQMTDDVLAFSKEMGVATDKAVPALYQAISAGVPRQNVMEFMRVASKAAIGGVTELETAVDGITSVINAYGVEALSAAKASDIMFTGVRLGKLTFDELSRALFNVVPTAVSLGISFEEVVGSLAALTAQGVPTTIATTQLRQAFVEASKSGTKLDTAIRELTGVGFGDLIATGQTAQEVFQMLRESMPEQAFRDLFGSVEAMNAILPLTGAGFEDAAAAIAEAGAATGATDKAWKTMEETTARKLTKAINDIKVEMTKLAVEVLPKLVGFYEDHLVPAIDDVKRAFDDWVDAMGPTTESLEELGAAAEDLADALGNLDISFGKSEGGMMEFLSGSAILRLHIDMLKEVMEMFTALLEGRWTDAFRDFAQLSLAPFRAAWEDTRGVVADVVVAMVKAVEWGVNLMIDILNDFIEALNTSSGWIKKLTFGLVDLGTIDPIQKMTRDFSDFEAMIRGSTDAVRDLGLEAGFIEPHLLRAADAARAFAGGGPGVDGGGGAGDGGPGAGGGGSLAQAVDILTPGMAALNAEIEREEVLLINTAKALTTATTQHDQITAAIEITEKALRDAERAMSDWENAALKGSRAFSDMAFGISQDMDRLQLKMNEITLGVLEEGLEEGGYASDALERKIRKLADTFGIELFGGKLDWDDIQKVLDAAGIGMEKLRIESQNVKLKENLSIGAQEHILDKVFEDAKGYAEYTLPEILQGFKDSKDEADKHIAALGDWNAALIVNEIHMTFLQGLLNNHQTYLANIRDLYREIEQAAQDAWSAAAQLPAGTSVTPALPVPVYHEGGYVPRTGLAMLRAGETVTPAGRGSAGTTVINNFNGPLLGDRRQLEATARALKPYLQRDRR